MQNKTTEFIRTLEKQIIKLPLKYQEEMYKMCAENCVRGAVFKEQKRQFDECGGDMDLIYEKYSRGDTYFRKIIEKGHIYEMGYPYCLCSCVKDGISTDKIHCECSRQSIIYILGKLMPDKKIKVETIETVLSGADKCRFRITIE